MRDDETDTFFEEEDREDEEREMERLLPFERLVMEEKTMRAEIVALRRRVRQLERKVNKTTDAFVAAAEQSSRNLLTAALAGAFDRKPGEGQKEKADEARDEIATTGFERTPGGAWLVTTEPPKVTR